MIPFDLWSESLIFSSIFAFIVLVPCVLVALIGRNMIRQLGQYPSKTPAIQMSIFLKLVTIEVVTFIMMIGFFRTFEH